MESPPIAARPSGALVYTARDGNLSPDQYERLKAELAVLLARVECMSELSRYWLAYLDIASQATD